MQILYIEILIFTLGLKNVYCKSQKGPYEAIVSNISSCVAKQPSWYHTNLSVYTKDGRNLLQGSFVTKRDFKDPRFRVRLNYTEQNMEVKAFEIKNQNCRNFIVKAVMGAVRMQYNSQKCLLKPVTIEFSNVDINVILHKLVEYLWHGTLEIHFEIWKTTTLLMCVDLNVQINILEHL